MRRFLLKDGVSRSQAEAHFQSLGRECVDRDETSDEVIDYKSSWTDTREGVANYLEASRDFEPRKSSEGYVNLDARGARRARFRVRRRRPEGSWSSRRADRGQRGAESGTADGSRP